MTSFKEFLAEKEMNEAKSGFRFMDDFKKNSGDGDKITDVLSNGARTWYAGFTVYHKFGSKENLQKALQAFADKNYTDENEKYVVSVRNVNPTTIPKETLEKNKKEGIFVTNVAVNWGKK